MPRWLGLLNASREVFFTCPLRVVITTETFGSKSFTESKRSHFFVGGKIRQIDDGFALARAADVGNFVDLQPVQPAAIGKDQDVAVRIRDEDIGDGVFVARLHADAAFAAAALIAIDRQAASA